MSPKNSQGRSDDARKSEPSTSRLTQYVQQQLGMGDPGRDIKINKVRGSRNSTFDGVRQLEILERRRQQKGALERSHRDETPGKGPAADPEYFSPSDFAKSIDHGRTLVERAAWEHEQSSTKESDVLEGRNYFELRSASAPRTVTDGWGTRQVIGIPRLHSQQRLRSSAEPRDMDRSTSDMHAHNWSDEKNSNLGAHVSTWLNESGSSSVSLGPRQSQGQESKGQRPKRAQFVEETEFSGRSIAASSDQVNRTNEAPKLPTKSTENSTKRLSLLEELFPSEAKQAYKDSQADNTVSSPSPCSDVPHLEPPNLDQLLGGYSQGDPGPLVDGNAASKEATARALRHDELTVLVLYGARPDLADDDFRRIVPKGWHIEGWRGPGDILKGDIYPLSLTLSAHPVNSHPSSESV